MASIETSIVEIERRIGTIENTQAEHVKQINQWKGAIGVVIALSGGSFLLQLFQMAAK